MSVNICTVGTLSSVTANTNAIVEENGALKRVKLNKVNESMTVTTIIYEKTLTANAYVSPYKYYGSFSIPENDITTYGEPISICATGSAGEPIPICFDTDRRGYRCNSYTNSSASVRIVYLKLPKT